MRGEEAEKKRKDEKEKLVAALGKWTERTSPARHLASPSFFVLFARPNIAQFFLGVPNIAQVSRVLTLLGPVRSTEDGDEFESVGDLLC